MTDAPTLGAGVPTPPIALTGETITPRIAAERVTLSESQVATLRTLCPDMVTDRAVLADAGRDWWPLAMTWAEAGQVGGIASVLCRPTGEAEVAAVARFCNAERIPLTVSGGRSGVVGGSVPVHGGVQLDLTSMHGIVAIDDRSLTVTVRAGTFGDHFEHALRTAYGLTAGHWPQSMALATVGGWAACRGAGQLSTRYGKIEDIVSGLRVVLADGSIIETGGQPREAAGPDLTQLFIGSEGTLGIITELTLRLHPAPPAERRAAYGFDSFGAGLEACRRILRRGATPAVLRLYDAIESDRSYHTGDTTCVLVVLDEGDATIIDATMTVVEQECDGATRLDDALVEHWLARRNDVSQLEALISGGYVVDTMEVTGPWSTLDNMYDRAIAAISAIDGVIVASAHQSHAYTDGACLYFTFAGKPEPEDRDRFYRAIWDAGTRAVLDAGGSLSHHHGIGANRARYMHKAHGAAMMTLQVLKSALDPNGILNPAKLGFDNPFGEAPLP